MGLEVSPDPEELEVSLFGPGVGEAIAVHLGGGSWMLVDSCINSATGVPASAQYLAQLGVPTEKVKLIVGTHWHDDHMRGLADLVDTYPDARFFCTPILKDGDFHAFVPGGSTRMLTSAGTSELAKVLDVFDDRQVRTGRNPMLVWPDRLLWQEGADWVRSLSPSDTGVREFLDQMTAVYPAAGDAKSRVSTIRPNETSVVLWIEVGDGVVLLGADLEHRANPLLGWGAILASHLRPQRRADVFKVPHHGSATGHDQELWDEMLVSGPIAVLTPFARSGLPRAEDVNRICALASEAYITAPLAPGKVRRRVSTVTKTIEGAVRYLREAEPPTGHIRLRKQRSSGAPWSVELFLPAASLCNP